MPLINKAFTGRLNFDTQAYRVPEGDWIDALNITRDADSGLDDVVSNIRGNVYVGYGLPAGVNKFVGRHPDKDRNRVYLFIWNSNGYNLWLYYDRNTNNIIKLIEDLTDTDGIPVLDFNPSKKINHINIIYNDVEGDLVSWTDGNTTPKKANVQHIINGNYSVIKSAFIERAKMPPLAPPTTVYGSDTTRDANSLRRTMFQHSYRWAYDDFEKSSISPYSKIPLPIGFYGSDNDIDDTKNNYITISVETGDENVLAIEILMRYNIGNAWSDVVKIASLVKADLGIPDNSTYQYLFYNDNLYPPITTGVQYLDGVQIIPLFFWVPQLADCEVLGNGNIPVYGAITEGYNNIPVNELDVTITAENVTNSPPDADPPSMSYTQSVQTFIFTVAGTVPEGTLYKVVALVNVPPMTSMILAQYTALAGDTLFDVANGMYAYMLANHGSYAQSVGGDTFTANLPLGSSILQVLVQAGSGGGGTSISTEKTWLWNCNYLFGLVYVDEQGRDMPGVTTFTNPVDSDNDFAVTTPPFSEDAGLPQTPVISAEINHLPPEGAVKYHWVRKQLTYGQWLFYETCDFQEDADYYYFCLNNIEVFKEENSQFTYGTLPLVQNKSRIRVIDGISGNLFDGSGWTQDYTILGTVERVLNGGSDPDDLRTFIKVKIPDAAPSPAYAAHMFVMVYVPAVNPTSAADSLWYEWGETYDIYELSGVRYHRGQDQDQTGSQPATFTWEEGDVYFHTRTMFNNIVGTPPYTNTDTVSLMDANFSDFFDSAVNDNGRGQAVEVNAKRMFNPVMVRFGGAYQTSTSVNENNVFYFEDFDEYDRSNGTIRKLFIEGRRMYTFQQFDIGIVPVLQQIIRDTAGNPLEANSTALLNKITYPYSGKLGIGDVPESFAYGKGAKYGYDNNKGVYWRIGLDGSITPLSIVYKCNAFFVNQSIAYNNSLNNGYPATGQPYTGNPTVYSGYNEYNNKIIICFEEINRYDEDGNLIFHQDPFTISFSETRNATEGFESPYSFHPEMIGSLNNLLFTGKDGVLWLHDSDTYCNFYGVQYGAFIKPSFNQNQLEKKTFTSIAELTSNTVWPCTEITTQLLNQSGQPQQSNLTARDFELKEGNYHATIKRDTGYGSTKYNGKTLKGNYMIMKFEIAQAPNFVYLNAVSLKYITSYLTTR